MVHKTVAFYGDCSDSILVRRFSSTAWWPCCVPPFSYQFRNFRNGDVVCLPLAGFRYMLLLYWPHANEGPEISCFRVYAVKTTLLLVTEYERLSSTRGRVEQLSTDWMEQGSNCGTGKRFYVLQNRPELLWGPLRVPFIGYQDCFPGVKGPELEADHSHPSVAAVSLLLPTPSMACSGALWPLLLEVCLFNGNAV